MGSEFSLIRIKLPRGEWKYDPDNSLGPEGGFGHVFAGIDKYDNPVAVKKIKIGAEEAAHRELDFADELSSRALKHIIPILDSGQDADSESYYVVMLRANTSLQDMINEEKMIDDVAASNVILEIAEGLSEVPDIVHRDLKPGNILYHESKWKIADFGIARFVEKATSLRTLKECLTPPYAAPEQWRLQHSTNATDIYALGCIGYFLLTGLPPFSGPSREDYQDQHLHTKPPKLEDQNPKLVSLLNMMLRKTPEARPNINRIKNILDEVANDSNRDVSNSGLNELANAGAQVAQHQLEFEAEHELLKTKREKRNGIAKAAIEILDGIITNLFEKICTSAPTASQVHESAIILGDAMLECIPNKIGSAISEGAFPQSGWDVVTDATIRVKQDRQPYEWSASLWYMKQNNTDNYRWFEVSYFDSPFVSRRHKYEPFAIQDYKYADETAAPVMGLYQIAWGPKSIDDEDAMNFCDRWAGLLAKASRHQLQHPRRLPLGDNYFD